MNWTVSVESLSEQLCLTETDRLQIERLLAFELSRYSDCMSSIEIRMDRTTFFGSEPEFRCELRTFSDRYRPVFITTRGASLEGAVTRAAARGARALARALQEAAVN